jgi:hypothetical protein
MSRTKNKQRLTMASAGEKEKRWRKLVDVDVRRKGERREQEQKY